MKRTRFARPVREKNIEDKCREIAELNGARLVKTVALGWPGFPDRMLLVPEHLYSCYIEFKRGDEQPTELQAKWHDLLRKSGQEVEVFRTVEEFLQLLQDIGVRVRLKAGATFKAFGTMG